MQPAHSSDRDAAGCLLGKKACLAALGQFGTSAAPRLLMPALLGSAAWHQQPWLTNRWCLAGRCTAEAGATALVYLAASCCEHRPKHS